MPPVNRGRFKLSLKHFGAKQFSWGVRAKPWGQTKRIDGAFIYAGTFRSGKVVGNGHVFTNTRGFSEKSDRFNAIEKEVGPSIPKEMVRGASLAAFQAQARDLQKDVEDMLAKITNGVIR